jgi:ankyrin repeat protein
MALLSAVLDNDLQKVEDLITHIDLIGDDINRGYPLYHAVRLGYLDIAHFLLMAGADPDLGPETTPLHVARTSQMVDILLTYRADPDTKDAQGRSALTDFDRLNLKMDRMTVDF